MNAHGMLPAVKPSPRKGSSVREELLLHSRYIRDTLAPLLAKQPKLNHSDSVCLHSLFKSLDGIPVTIDLLRYSRIEKALMVIVAAGNVYWPMDIVVHAEKLIAKWEEELGPLKNLRADLYGPGGRMEGIRKISWKNGHEPDDERKSAWSVEGEPNPSRAHAFGHLGFEVGEYVPFMALFLKYSKPDVQISWWLKPAAAYRDGIIDETSHGITANENGAYAIVLTGNCEVDLGRDRAIRYTAAVDDPGVFRLTKTMQHEDPEQKVVRVLRSWKLRSKIAPKAGLRYDGLYRILSFSVHLSPSNTWHTAFTLSRVPTQPSLLSALQIPTSDQLDDWKDYQRLKLIDGGDDFAMLREILASEGTGDTESRDDGRHGSEDSGYFSRNGSTAASAGDGRRESFLRKELEDLIGLENTNKKNDDEEAEEADDEGAGLGEDIEDYEFDTVSRSGRFDARTTGPRTTVPRNYNSALNLNNDAPSTKPNPIPYSTTQTHPPSHPPTSTLPQKHQSHLAPSFISPRRPAAPHISADEAVGGGSAVQGGYLGKMRRGEH